MRRTTLLLCALFLTASLASGQDKGKDKDKDKKPDPGFEAYLKFAQPGEKHKLLDPIIGDWTYTSKFWFDPSQPPSESKGTAQRKWIMGNRYVQEDIQGEVAGQKFAGMGLTGYDNGLKKYVGAWVDNLGTGIMNSTGTVDATGKILTSHSETHDPVMAKTVKDRMVLTIVSADQNKLEMYRVLPDGKEMKSMEINLTRKK